MHHFVHSARVRSVVFVLVSYHVRTLVCFPFTQSAIPDVRCNACMRA